MKKIFAAIFAIAALVSCSLEQAKPEQPEVAEEGSVVVNFGVDVPMLGETGTKAFSDEPGTNISNLYVAVFDDTGYLAEYKRCTCEDGYPTVSTNDSLGTDVRKYKVVLNVSKFAPRIMHFIANGPDHVTFGSEEEVIASMIARLNPGEGELGPDVYWQRVELTKGITYEPGTHDLNSQSARELKHIGLIRNFAEFAIESDASEFELTCAKILMSPDMGYVAPYNKTTGGFVMDYAHKTADQLLALGYIGSAPATARVSADFTNPTAATGGKVSQFMFEREKPTSAPACVIVGGHYNGSSDVQYYKVNLVDSDGEYYPIMRNFKYQVKIVGVHAKGKASIEDAYNSGGTGDISITFEYKDLTNVSNGESRMLVQYVEKLVVTDAEFELRYKFVPNITTPSTTANNQAAAGSQGVQITVQDPSELRLGAAIDHITVSDTDNDDGSRTIRIKPVSPSAFQKTQTITIKGTAIVGGVPKTIQRVVTIIVRDKLILTANCNPTTVAATTGSDVDLHINLPKGLRQSVFPLLLNIEAENLSITPASSDNLPVESGKSLVNTDKPGYHFVKTVDWDDYYVGSGETVDDSSYNTDVVCHFKTSKDNSASRIVINNEYFNDATTFFTNPGVSLGLKFTSLTYSTVRSDGSVDFSFSMENTDPVTVTLENLVPTMEENSLRRTSTDGVYTYTPTAAGVQTFKLQTTGGGDGTYTTSLQSDMYEPAGKKGTFGIAIALPNPWHVDAATVSGSTKAPAVGFQSTLTAYVHFIDAANRNVKFYVGSTELTPTSSSSITIDGLDYYVYSCNYTPTTQGYYKFRVEAWNTGSETGKKVLERTGTNGFGVWGHAIGLANALTSVSYNTTTSYVLKNSQYGTYLYWNGSNFVVEANTDEGDIATNTKYHFKFSSTSDETHIYNVLANKDIEFNYDSNAMTSANRGSGASIEIYGYSSSYRGFKMRDNNDSGFYVYRHMYQDSATSVKLYKNNSYSSQNGYWQIIPIVETFTAPM